MKYASVFIVAQLMSFIKTDNLVLLSGTLRQFEQAGCDDDQMALKCPPGTSISVELAQFDPSGAKNARCQARVASGSAKNCSWPSPIQNKWEEMTKGTWGRYSLLQTVVEACQKKKSCKFRASPRPFDGDLCPGERKHVEVAYKCRPYEFRSRVACEDERVQLQCNPNSRVAIYSASYGRTEYESFQCPQPQGVAEETCLVSYATETVMRLCHGKRQCDFGANSATFGNPCRPQTKMYLRIVYTCVPQKVLNSEYEEPLGDDETEQDFAYDQDDFDNLDTTREKIREFAASPANSESGTGPGHLSTNLDQISKTNYSTDQPHSKNTSKGTLSSQESFNKDRNAQSFEENTYIYVLLTLGAASLLCVIIVTSRMLVRRHHDVPAAAAAKFQAKQTTNSLNLVGETTTSLDLGAPLPVQPHGHQAQLECDRMATRCANRQQLQDNLNALNVNIELPHVHVHSAGDYYYG